MSGVAPDPLDAMADRFYRNPDLLTVDEFDALVEVARAARDMQRRRVPMTPALGRALMKLDRLEGK